MLTYILLLTGGLAIGWVIRELQQMHRNNIVHKRIMQHAKESREKYSDKS